MLEEHVIRFLLLCVLTQFVKEGVREILICLYICVFYIIVLLCICICICRAWDYFLYVEEKKWKYFQETNIF